MKIVKLNGNFNIHKYHGFEVGLKFTSWGLAAQQFEKAAANRLGRSAWSWKYNSGESVRENWASGFGKRSKAESATPYWIYLRNESMLTMLMLSLDHEHAV